MKIKFVATESVKPANVRVTLLVIEPGTATRPTPIAESDAQLRACEWAGRIRQIRLSGT